MENKKITTMISRLKIAYPYYFKDLTEEDITGMFVMYSEKFNKYNEETLKATLNKIIDTRKYMPSISELLEECNNSITFKANDILARMYQDGYFKQGYEELDETQANRNYEKALMWVESKNIPCWLKEDMRKYEQKLLPQERLMIENV